MFKLFLCSNVLFNVGKDPEKVNAVFNRYKEMRMCSHFDRTGDRTEEDFEKLEFIANAKLEEELLTEYYDDLIHYFIGYSRKYYQSGLPPLPSEFVKASNETKMKNNDFAVWFWKEFKIADGCNISIDELLSHSSKITERNEMIKQVKKLGLQFDKDLFGFGTKPGKEGKEVYIKGGIKGFQKKGEDEDD